MKLSKDLMCFFIIPVVLIIGIILTVAFTVFYTTTVRTPSGEIINSNWLKEFTLDFSQYRDMSDGTPTISATGKKLLKKTVFGFRYWTPTVGMFAISISRP